MILTKLYTMKNKYKPVRRGLAVAVLGLFLFPAVVAAQVYAWAKDFGGAGNAEAKSIAQDTAGNIYIAGQFFATVDFDPGAGTTSLTSNGGSQDVFLVKLDVNGDFVWARQFSGPNFEFGGYLVIDAAGDILLTGSYLGSVDMDPGAGTLTLTSAGGADIFECKVNSAGNLVWARSCGGSDNDYAYGITIDGSGNTFVTGGFKATADFDPGAGVFNLTASGSSEDMFVFSLDQNGGFRWAAHSNNAASDNAEGIATDASGNVYIAGVTSGGTVWKFNNTGTLQWTRNTTTLRASAVEPDQSGNIYVTGYFSTTADLDPGAGTYNVTAIGTFDVYVQKLDANGDFAWGRAVGSAGYDYGYDIALDPSGAPYVAGAFDGNMDFDPGAGTYYIVPGAVASFVLKLTPSGDFAWAVHAGSPGYNQAQAVFVNSDAEVFAAGRFDTSVDFDPSAGIDSLSNTSPYMDAYAWKLAPCMAPDMIVVTASDSVICAGDSVTLTVAGNLNDATGWSWYSGTCGGTPAGSGTSIQVTPGTSADYYVRGEGGCVATAATCTAVTISVNPLPPVTLNLAAQDTQCVTSSSVVLTGYSPAGGTLFGSTINGTTFYPDSAGVGVFPITYVYTDTNGCTATATDSIYVDVCTGMEVAAEQTGLLVYPSPVAGLLTVSTPGAIGDLGIFSQTGACVFSARYSTSSAMIDMSSFSAGIYLIRIDNGESVLTKRIVKTD